MKLQSIALALAAAFTAVSAEPELEEPRVSYDGYKIFRIDAPAGPEEVKSRLVGLDTVELSVGEAYHVDVAVAPADLEVFESLGFDVEVLTEDLGVDLAEEGEVTSFFDDNSTESTLAARQVDNSWFTAYRPWAEHRTFWNNLQASAPSNSRIFNVGSSFQGRELYGFHLWGSGGQGSKPAVYFTATVHAREWITAPVVEYVARQLVNGWNGNDATVRGFLEKYDFYFVPFLNPDGFVYSQTTNRLWRKNRQTRSGTSCVGTDGNRNWNYQWSVPGGASTDPCSETYKGLAGGDTPEIRAAQTFTNTLRTRGVKLYVDWHSYGQYILLPYGYNCAARAPNHSRQMTIAGGHASRVQAVSGTRFTYGPSCSTLYASTGSGPDYLSGVTGAEFSWTIELRPGPNSANGFVLPAAQILPSAVEQWEGLKYVFANV